MVEAEGLKRMTSQLLANGESCIGDHKCMMDAYIVREFGLSFFCKIDMIIL